MSLLMFIAGFKLKTRIQKWLCDLRSMLEFPLLHPMRELEKVALQESVAYIQRNMPRAVALETAREVLDLAIAEVKREGHFLEFGVYKGGTIRYLAKRIGGHIIHGFDSFEGLPERWVGGNCNARQGTFDLGGKLPRVPRNVRLYKGLFSDTLPGWVKENEGPVAFLHIDCDLYSSTACVLDLLQSRIVPGTVIVFDEYFNYYGWQNHEYKAFQEFVSRGGVKYEYLGFARLQVAVKIIEVAGSGSEK
jgi:hypothetical protein